VLPIGSSQLIALQKNNEKNKEKEKAPFFYSNVHTILACEKPQ